MQRMREGDVKEEEQQMEGMGEGDAKDGRGRCNRWEGIEMQWWEGKMK